MPTTIPPHERAAKEFWLYAVRHKCLVLGIVAVSNLLALILFSLADFLYEDRLGVVVGRAYIDGKIRSIGKANAILRRLQLEYESSGAKDSYLNVYPLINIEDRGRDRVFIYARGSDREAMRKFIVAPLHKLLSEHESILEASQTALETAVQELQARLDAINRLAERDVAENHRPRTGDSKPENGAEEYGESIPTEKTILEARINQLRSQIFEHKPSRVLETPAASGPVSPKLILYMFLASALGINLGLIGAVVLGKRNERMVHKISQAHFENWRG